ncbi:MAG: tetratricopeptide repeat protein [Rhodospirillaceae bacterium]
MAKPPVDDAAQEALFREVSEDLRQDRLTALWKQYGSWMIGAAVALVLGVAGSQIYKGMEASSQRASAAAFEAAITQARSEDPLSALDDLATLAGDSSSGFAAIAALERGSLLARDAQTLPEAVGVWQDVANNTDYPDTFRDAARMLAAFRGLDILDKDTVLGLLAPLRVTGSPWANLADETAALAALKAGDTTEAIEGFSALYADFQIPAHEKARIGILLSALGVDPATVMPATPPSAPGGDGSDG